MNLLKLENNINITSNIIAELTNKRHDNVIRDIEEIAEQLKSDTSDMRSDILETTYENRGKNYKNYTLSQDGMMLLITGYSAPHRMKLIKYCRELENKISVPTNFKEALQLALKQQEEIDALELENKNNIPKIEFYEAVTGSDDTFDLGTVAKVINKKGYGRNNLFEFLRENKILMQNNQPYQKYVDQGLFRMIESKFAKPTGDTCINIKTVVFQKGVDYINKLLSNNV